MSLVNKECKPCHGGVPPLNTAEVTAHLKEITDWTCDDKHACIQRQFSFPDFLHTMNFVNAVAYIAEQQGHHPDLAVGYNYCHVTFTTHAIGGLSENDFICAAKIDLLAS